MSDFPAGTVIDHYRPEWGRQPVMAEHTEHDHSLASIQGVIAGEYLGTEPARRSIWTDVVEQRDDAVKIIVTDANGDVIARAMVHNNYVMGGW